MTTTFTLGEAAKRLNLSKPTVSKFVREGRIAAKKVQTGKVTTYRIDGAELSRFEASYDKPTNGKRPGEAPKDTRGKGTEMQIVLADLARAKERVAELTQDRDRLRLDLDKAQDRLDKLQDQLADIAAAQVQQGRVPFWQKLIGKGQ